MGNWINKEWSQIDALSGDEEPSNSAKKLKLKTTSRKRLSLNNSQESNSSNKISCIDETGSTPNVPKLMIADLDPRSPSTGIVRTPICLVENDKAKKLSNLNPSKFPVFDPRSPTNEYNRTPIHLNNNNNNNNKDANENENDSNASFNVSVASFSLDSSSLIGSDSSMLLQQVPDNCLTNTSNVITTSNANNDITPSKLHKLISSNLPRHILQRKQVAKLNKKKLIESNNQDKENNILN